MKGHPDIFTALLLCFLVLAPGFALAQNNQNSFNSGEVANQGLVICGNQNEEIKGPTPQVGNRRCTAYDIFNTIIRVVNFLIAIAGIWAVRSIVGAGFWIIVAAGNEEKITENKKALMNSIYGFALVLMAFVLVNTILDMVGLIDGLDALKNPLKYINPLL